MILIVGLGPPNLTSGLLGIIHTRPEERFSADYVLFI